MEIDNQPPSVEVGHCLTEWAMRYEVRKNEGETDLVLEESCLYPYVY